ncbi:MAG: hypothetical protein ACJ8F2_01235 [Xanthobacteraceae bacterium]
MNTSIVIDMTTHRNRRCLRTLSVDELKDERHYWGAQGRVAAANNDPNYEEVAHEFVVLIEDELAAREGAAR